MPHPKSGYKLKDGSKVPGVTTIIGRFKDSGGLLWWAFEQGKSAERGEISSLYDKRDEAADAGTLAHSMVEAHIDGKIYLMSAEIPKKIRNQARQGFENYQRGPSVQEGIRSLFTLRSMHVQMSHQCQHSGYSHEDQGGPAQQGSSAGALSYCVSPKTV